MLVVDSLASRGEGQRITISPRFCGPPSSGNGGYTSGLLAEQLNEPCSVTLRSPPPLDTPLALSKNAQGHVQLHHGKLLVAEAEPKKLELEVPEPVSFQVAALVTDGFVGFQSHPYPTCFVCGPERPHADGLGLYPGAVPGRQLVAAAWSPSAELCNSQGDVAQRYVWSALDCPAWFGFLAFSERKAPTLLGRMAADVQRAPRRGEQCVIMGWHLGTEGRRILCASAMFGADRQCIARAIATWVMLRSLV